MKLLELTLLVVWTVVPLVFGYLNWRVAVSIAARMKVLRQNIGAQTIGRDYLAQSVFGLAVACLFELTVILTLVRPQTVAAETAALVLLLAIPLLFLGHSVYLYRRVVRPSAS